MTRVIENNKWEYRTYFAGDLKLTPENFKNAIILFPDGTKTDLPTNIVWQEETHYYYDHGHKGSATSWVPYIDVDLHGLKIKVKLTDVEVIL